MTAFTDITYPELSTFDPANPVIPGPVGAVQRELWSRIEAQVDDLAPGDFKSAVHQAWISDFARGYERLLLTHDDPAIRRAGLVLFRIRRDGDAIVAELRAQAEQRRAALEAAAADQERQLAAERRDAAATRDLVVRELKLAKVGPGGRLVARPSSATSSPPPAPRNDRLRRPTPEYLAEVESARRAFVRALHRAGLYAELSVTVLRTNLATDGTVADGLKPLKQGASVFDVEFCIRSMRHVRAFLTDTGRELIAA